MTKLMKKHFSVDISFGSIFWVLFSLLAVKFIGNIMDILFLIFSAMLIAMAVYPLVNWFAKRKINRKLSTLFILLSFFGVITGIGVSIAGPLTQQSELFIQKLPVLIENIGLQNIDVNQLQTQFSFVPGQIFKIALGTFEGLITIFAVVVISFYMVQEIPKIPEYLAFWYGKEKGERYYEIVKKLEIQIGNWTRGELILMLSVGLSNYIGYSIIGIPYALVLGVLAGLMEIIPNIGPTVAAIPAILVGLSYSPTLAAGALIVALLTQQLENQLLVPLVMKKAIGLNPIVTIVVLITALKLGGPLLGILALPLVLSLRVILAHIKVNKDTNIPEIQ